MNGIYLQDGEGQQLFPAHVCALFRRVSRRLAVAREQVVAMVEATVPSIQPSRLGMTREMRK